MDIDIIDDPIDVTTEQGLINVFGKPISTDAQYEYWMSASSFLSYGGVLKVCRTDGTTLNNANAGVGTAKAGLGTTAAQNANMYADDVKIKNYDDYLNNWDTSTAFTYASKDPGTWANTLKVCVIDNYADQTIGIATTAPGGNGVTIGFGVTTALSAITIPGTGT